MNGSRFLLIRHAQSANNALPESQRVSDPPLTTLGVTQSQLLAERIGELQIDRLYCSGFLRALQTTAAIVKRLPLKPYVHADLFEVKGCYSGSHPAQYQSEPGLGRAAIIEQFGDWTIDPGITDDGWHYGRPVECEDLLGQRLVRIEAWMRQMIEADRSQAVDVGELAPKLRSGAKPGSLFVHAAVVHADLIVRLLDHLIGDDEAIRYPPEPYNASITMLEWSTRQKWDLIGYSDAAHLPPRLRTF